MPDGSVETFPDDWPEGHIRAEILKRFPKAYDKPETKPAPAAAPKAKPEPTWGQAAHSGLAGLAQGYFYDPLESVGRDVERGIGHRILPEIARRPLRHVRDVATSTQTGRISREVGAAAMANTPVLGPVERGIQTAYTAGRMSPAVAAKMGQAIQALKNVARDHPVISGAVQSTISALSQPVENAKDDIDYWGQRAKQGIGGAITGAGFGSDLARRAATYIGSHAAFGPLHAAMQGFYPIGAGGWWPHIGLWHLANMVNAAGGPGVQRFMANPRTQRAAGAIVGQQFGTSDRPTGPDEPTSDEDYRPGP
jgi:uncharacterized protein YbjT (DUF2867 family)